MKTTWSYDYIVRKPTSWINEKRKGLERRTGIHWSTWYASGKQVFAPDWREIEPNASRRLADITLIAVSLCDTDFVNAIPFLKVYEKVHQHSPEFTLYQVIASCKYLVKDSKLRITVGRTGEAYAVKVNATA